MLHRVFIDIFHNLRSDTFLILKYKLELMINLVILGAGTTGKMMTNHLVSKLSKKEWTIHIYDQHKTHYYQTGFLFLLFDICNENQLKKVLKKFTPTLFKIKKK